MPVGSGPTGVAVDAAGKIWATNYNAGTVSRINPLAGPIGSDGITRVGAVDFTTVNLGGNPYNYSDMTGSTLQVPPEVGNWTAVFDSGIAGAEWGNITWSASTCGNGAVTVTAATSTNGTTFTLPQPVTPGAELTIADGRYLRVTVKLERAKGGDSPILYDLSVGTVGYPLLPSTPPNAAPSVDAGADQTVILPRKALARGRRVRRRASQPVECFLATGERDGHHDVHARHHTRNDRGVQRAWHIRAASDRERRRTDQQR